MDGLEDTQVPPQTFLYGCVLEAGKEVTFNPDEDEFEHQVDLRMACVDTTTKDELHTVEVEGQDTEGQTVKAVLVSLKPSTLPSVCLGGFTVTPPAVFRLKAGSGPIHISGQHLVMMGAEEFDEDDDEEDEEEEEEEEEDVKTPKKRPASSPAKKSKKKMKMDMEEDDEDEDDEDDDEDMEDDDDEDISEAEESPVKAKAAKPQTNGKSAKPAAAQDKTPKKKGKAEKPKTPPTPKEPLTIPEIKTKMMEALKKGTTLPKVQPKFENLLKNGYRVTDAKVVAELWKWRQTLKEAK